MMDTKAAGIIAMGLVAAALILGLVPKVSSLSSIRPGAVPVAAGELVSVQVWKYPVEHTGNEGGTYTKGRVEVYDRFILVVHPKGERTLHLHGSYTDLRFKSD
jgi:hypothetical protein